jgi:hypothetical protein
MKSIGFPVSKAILLTGAGFTHNFGGYLARTMWAEIHNRIQQTGQVRLIELMKNHFDYEELYQEVLSKNTYTEQEKSVFSDAVFNAYDALDGVVRDYQKRYINTTPVDLDSVNELIFRFAGDRKEKGFFFTLNQDLFIERYYSSSLKIVYPGLNVNYVRFNIGRDKELKEEDFIIVPDEKELERHKKRLQALGSFYYIKLHGSYDWRGSGNKNKLVIGLAKKEQIRKEPILSWYYELFEKVLSQPQKYLLIIGYGFRDPHINEVLARAIVDSGLKLFIINPIDPQIFLDQTLSNMSEHKEIIWSGVAGYYPFSFQEFFPYGVSSTQHYRSLKTWLFGY